MVIGMQRGMFLAALDCVPVSFYHVLMAMGRPFDLPYSVELLGRRGLARRGADRAYR